MVLMPWSPWGMCSMGHVFHGVNALVSMPQVVTDMRIWLRDAIATLKEDALQLVATMVERASV